MNLLIQYDPQLFQAVYKTYENLRATIAQPHAEFAITHFAHQKFYYRRECHFSTLFTGEISSFQLKSS